MSSMAFIFADGFDWGDAAHCGGQIGGTLPANPAKYALFGQTNVSIVPGRLSAANSGTGQALRFGSSGFEQQTLTRKNGFISTPCLGFAHRLVDSAGAYTICRFENADTKDEAGAHDNGTNNGTVLALMYLADGTLSVNTGPVGLPGGLPEFPGTVLWTSGFTLPLLTWIYMELLCDPTAGTWSLYFNDVLIVSQTGVSFGISTPILQFSICSESFSVHDMDDLYCTSGNRLGPVQVTGFPPNIGSTHQWTPLTGTNVSQIQEFGNRIPLGLPTPDDGLSYVEASSSGTTDLYGFAEPACYGRILALALNVDGSAIIGSPSVNWLIKQEALLTNLGSSDAYIGGYTIRQGISELNPVTSTFWSDADIGSALFGFQFAGSGDARVTQFMLEKVVSLRSVPFSCGQGNYSFTI